MGRAITANAARHALGRLPIGCGRPALCDAGCALRRCRSTDERPTRADRTNSQHPSRSRPARPRRPRPQRTGGQALPRRPASAPANSSTIESESSRVTTALATRARGRTRRGCASTGQRQPLCSSARNAMLSRRRTTNGCVSSIAAACRPPRASWVCGGDRSVPAGAGHSDGALRQTSQSGARSPEPGAPTSTKSTP